MKQIDISGFESYQITDDGRVWSKKNSIFLKTHDNGNGSLMRILPLAYIPEIDYETIDKLFSDIY